MVNGFLNFKTVPPTIQPFKGNIEERYRAKLAPMLHPTTYVLSDINNDGIWEGTFSLPAGDFEYIFCADGWTFSEASALLANGSASGDWSCTPVTDYLSLIHI